MVIDLSEFRGEWIVVKDEEVLAHNSDPYVIAKEINRMDDISDIRVFRVPGEGEPEFEGAQGFA